MQVAIVGGGPIGLEALRAAVAAGHDAHLFEGSTEVAGAVRRWGFVRLFSPFGMNRSDEARERLERAGAALPADDALLTGNRYAEAFLEPLASLPEHAGRVHTGCRVSSIGRRGCNKSTPLGEARKRREGLGLWV